MERLPGKEAFVTFGMLDEYSAYREFGGKTNAEVLRMLSEPDMGLLEYSESYMFMGEPAFCFYFDALAEYVRDGEFDYDEVRRFVMICGFRLEWEHEDMRTCPTKVRTALEAVARRLEKRLTPLDAIRAKFEGGEADARTNADAELLHDVETPSAEDLEYCIGMACLSREDDEELLRLWKEYDDREFCARCNIMAGMTYLETMDPYWYACACHQICRARLERQGGRMACAAKVAEVLRTVIQPPKQMLSELRDLSGKYRRLEESPGK